MHGRHPFIVLLILAATACSVIPQVAVAQEINLREPIRARRLPYTRGGVPYDQYVCADIGLSFSKPAIAEWSYWVGGGLAIEQLATPTSAAFFAIRGGASVDFELSQFGREHQYGGRYELRLGPWLGGDTTFRSGAIEAGGLLSFGQTYQAVWGTSALRLGGGVAARSGQWVPSGSLTLTWGIRSVAGRYFQGGGCVGVNGNLESIDEGGPRHTHAFASGARVFMATRLTGDRDAALLVGIEFEPTFFLPPYSGFKFIGSNPNPR